jgi:hypothetical protein
MEYITTEDGADGFGSQMFSRISGIIYANSHGLKYINYPFSGILLEDRPEQRNSELEKSNNLLSSIIRNLEVKSVDEVDGYIELYTYNRLYIYYQILCNPDQYFTEEVLKKFQDSYTLDKPEYYKNNKLNIAIHIRRGNDIRSDDPVRYVNSDLYDRIIQKLLEKYEDSVVHIFSWNDPQISIKSERIVYHTTLDGGESFLSDFNGLVHADILLVGSSTFSLSSGIFNKNTVLCTREIFKLETYNTPFVPIWEKNFENIVGSF